MNPLPSTMCAVLAGAAVLFVVVSRPVHAEVVEATKRVSGAAVHYKVVLPDGYDPARTYPAVLVFGGGPQTMNTIDRTLMRNFREQAEKRGYIVIAPAAPDGQLFFQGGARLVPEFLRMVLSDYRIQDGKFHVAGPSNGGIAAFHVAAQYPQYFVSVTAFPGYMWQPNAAKLEAIEQMCVFMYVGEFDEYMWHGEMKREADFLRSKGTLANYVVERGQPHGIATLTGAGAARLFDGFEQVRKGCRQ